MSFGKDTSVKKRKNQTEGVKYMTPITSQQLHSFRFFLFNEEKAPATIEKYIHDVQVFSLWLDERSLDKAAVVAYKNHLTQHYAPASVNAALSSLNCYFSFAQLYQLKVKNLKVQRKIFTTLDQDLTKEEYDRLLLVAQKTNRRLYLLIQTICSTGIRVSEVRFITLEAVECGLAHISCKGKQRQVLLPQRLCQILQAYANDKHISTGPIFVTRSGHSLDRSNIWADMKKLCTQAQVSPKKVYPHNLRHFFARTYYTTQKDIVRLADILGHSSVNTTRIYTMESGAIHREQIENLGLVK